MDTPELEFILRCVERTTALSIRGKSRQQRYVRARMIYCRIARNITNYSFSEIGRLINRDHASAIHYNKRFEIDIWKDHKWRPIYISCLNQISDVDLPDLPYRPDTMEALIDKISEIQDKFLEYKKDVERREKEEKPLLDIYRQMPQEQKDRLLFQAKTLLKVSEVLKSA